KFLSEEENQKKFGEKYLSKEDRLKRRFGDAYRPGRVSAGEKVKEKELPGKIKNTRRECPKRKIAAKASGGDRKDDRVPCSVRHWLGHHSYLKGTCSGVGIEFSIDAGF